MDPGHGPQDENAATVILWNADGTERSRLPGAWGPVQFSADSQTLATHGAEGVVNVYDVPAGRLRCTIASGGMEISRFVLSQDGRQVALVEERAGQDRNIPVHLYDVDTGRATAVLHGETQALRSLAWSPNGRTLATGHGDRFMAVGWIKHWDAQTGQELATFWGHHSLVHDLLFTPEGKRLLSASATEIKFWDPVTGQEVLSLPGGGRLQLAQGGQLLAVGPNAANGSRLRLWRSASAEEVVAPEPR